MIIAEYKKKENIIEYILYIRQIVNIIRINNFDIDIINNLIIEKYEVGENKKAEIRDWYINIINKIKSENIEKTGDLKFIKELIEELNQIHLEMLSDSENYRHKELYRWAKSNIDEFKILSQSKSDNEIEICINALNHLLLLRLQNIDISVETLQAMQTFSNLLADIALKYKNSIVFQIV